MYELPELSSAVVALIIALAQEIAVLKTFAAFIECVPFTSAGYWYNASLPLGPTMCCC